MMMGIAERCLPHWGCSRGEDESHCGSTWEGAGQGARGIPSTKALAPCGFPSHTCGGGRACVGGSDLCNDVVPLFNGIAQFLAKLFSFLQLPF